MTRERDEILEHEADGIREFDNDLPRWWLYGFYFTIVLAALYLVNFHVLPVPLVGPASIQAEYEADMAAAAAARPPATASAASTGGASGGSVGRRSSTCTRPTPVRRWRRFIAPPTSWWSRRCGTG